MKYANRIITHKRKDFIARSIIGAFSFLKETVFSDEYASLPGLMQGLDPRIKIAAVLLLLMAALFSRSIYFIAGMYIFCLALAAASSIKLGFFLKRTWVFIPIFSLFIAMPAIFDIFSPGETLAKLHILGLSLSVTRQGLSSGTIFFTRVLTSVSLCVLLVLTTRHFVLLNSLRVFKIPRIFIMTAGMCYRYIYLFVEIIQNTYIAIKSRVGFVRSVKDGQGMVAWNIASLWQRSWSMHTHVYEAMISRGYTGEPKVIDEFRTGPKDWACLGISILIFGSSLWQNHFLN